MPLQPMITGARAMISAGHYLATEAGWAVLRAGGNAIDAGVAAGIALGVVHCDQVQFPGVAPMVIYLAERDEVITIAGLGGWPRAARIERLVGEHGGTVPPGVLRTVVPAAPDAWILALENYGTMSFGDVAAAAIRYASDGFTVHPVMEHFVTRYESSYRLWPENTAIWLSRGRPPREGELFVQPDLARAIQFMADEERAAARHGRTAGLAAARDALYRGDLARAIVRCHREHDGWLTADDLASYRSEIAVPTRLTFRDTEVLTCGPWCQGPVLLQMLALLDGVDLKALGHNTTAYAHVVTEAMKLAFADRDHYYGDPRFVRVPMETLLSPAYNVERRRMIRDDRAWPEMPAPGRVAGFDQRHAAADRSAAALAAASRVMPADTSYVCVVDAQGNVMSATPSDSSWDGPVIPGLGFVPSTRGSQSWAVPGHPSCVAPGKRPRLTPAPAMAFKNGRVFMQFGTPGGDVQQQAMLQFFLNVTVFGMPPQRAVEQPRVATRSFPDSFWPHAYAPGKLEAESRIPAETRQALADLGHSVSAWPELEWRAGAVDAVMVDDEGTRWAAADPRRGAQAIGN